MRHDELCKVIPRSRASCLLALVVVIVLGVSPESSRRTEPSQGKPPGGMVVLPGYTFTRIRGIDSELGQFEKPAGPKISYELGPLGGPLVDNPRSPDILWSKTLVARGTTVRAFMVKGDQLRIDNGFGNFIARNVRTHEDVADVLLMTLSYDPDVRRRELDFKKQ